MSTFFIIAVLILLFVVIFQIAKASEYVAVLKGEEKSRKQNNKINGFLMIVFLILGLIGVYFCHEILAGRTLHESASKEGEKVDEMLHITLAVTGIVFVITQILLFWFAYKYQESEKRKVFFFPHNNTMEVVWTVVPAMYFRNFPNPVTMPGMYRCRPFQCGRTPGILRRNFSSLVHRIKEIEQEQQLHGKNNDCDNTNKHI